MAQLLEAGMERKVSETTTRTSITSCAQRRDSRAKPRVRARRICGCSKVTRSSCCRCSKPLSSRAARYFGRGVAVQVLNNVQNGLCPEDCGYCSQSRDSEAAIRKYPMKSDDEILAEAERAPREAGASRYCMVLSGRGPTLERTRAPRRL